MIGACRRIPPVNGIRPHSQCDTLRASRLYWLRFSEALRLYIDDFDSDQGIILSQQKNILTSLCECNKFLLKEMVFS